MRVLQMLRDGSPNGITTYNRILAHELVAQRHEVAIWPAAAGFGSADMVRLPPAHPLVEPLLRRWITARLRPDALFVNNYTQARFAHQLRARTGTPWIACMHNGHSEKRMMQWRQLLGNASGIVTMSATLHTSYAELMNSGLLSPPPVLLSRLPMTMPDLRTRKAGQRLTLGYCSRLSGYKGPRCESWLEAIARLPTTQALHVLVIGGGTHLPRLRAKAAHLGLHAEFTGTVEDPVPWLDRVDVITGAGYALMEGLVRGAAAVGLGFGGCTGAITAETFDAACAVNFGDHCLHAVPSDAKTIADALLSAIASLGSHDLAELHARARQHFAAMPIVKGLVDFITHVIDTPALTHGRAAGLDR